MKHLQADETFARIPDSVELVTLIDNVGILDLDICRCYMQLESMSALPDAHKRLSRARECFNRCYGPEEDMVCIRLCVCVRVGAFVWSQRGWLCFVSNVVPCVAQQLPPLYQLHLYMYICSRLRSRLRRD